MCLELSRSFFPCSYTNLISFSFLFSFFSLCLTLRRAHHLCSPLPGFLPYAPADLLSAFSLCWERSCASPRQEESQCLTHVAGFRDFHSYDYFVTAGEIVGSALFPMPLWSGRGGSQSREEERCALLFDLMRSLKALLSLPASFVTDPILFSLGSKSSILKDAMAAGTPKVSEHNSAYFPLPPGDAPYTPSPSQPAPCPAT